MWKSTPGVSVSPVSAGIRGLATILPIACAVAGCNLITAPCAGPAWPALSVTVVDSVSGGPISGVAGMVIATDGAYADTVEFPAVERPRTAAGLAEEREGTYTVEVLMDGYAVWRVEGLRVDADRCNVRTREVLARLQPAG